MFFITIFIFLLFLKLKMLIDWLIRILLIYPLRFVLPSILFMTLVSAAPSSTKTQLVESVECQSDLQTLNETVNKMMFLFDPNVVSIESPEELQDIYCVPFPGWAKDATKY